MVPDSSPSCNVACNSLGAKDNSSPKSKRTMASSASLKAQSRHCHQGRKEALNKSPMYKTNIRP
jgi:hypothetical protein